MKVLYSTQSTVEYDGVHYYNNPVQATYKRYLTLGKDITVFCPQRRVERPHSDLIDEGAVKFVFVKKVNSIGDILRHANNWNDRLAEKLVRETDVCVCHVPCGHSYQVIKYAKKYGKPYLTVVCGCPWDALWNYDWRGKLLAPMAYFTLKKIMKDAPYSIYVTSEFLQRRYPTNGKSIGCSNVNITTGISSALELRLSTIEALKKNGRILRIGTAAAINVPYKGQEFVIRALGSLKRKGIKFEYHLIGKGDQDRLRGIAQQENVEDEVFFHGVVPHDKVLGFLKDLDIYIQPSKQEGLPRSVIEAMSQGCLCMGTAIAGIPELLDNRYLFSKGDSLQIASLLENISIDDLIIQAKRNYEHAKQYDMNILNERRKRFIMEFKNNYFE